MKTVLGFFTILLCAEAAFADQVTMKNGDRLSGTILPWIWATPTRMAT